MENANPKLPEGRKRPPPSSSPGRQPEPGPTGARSAADRAHSATRCKLLISLAMPVSTINTPMTSATARYADSLRLSVAPMMDGEDFQWIQ